LEVEAAALVEPGGASAMDDMEIGPGASWTARFRAKQARSYGP
jgi:hypothetical protein